MQVDIVYFPQTRVAGIRHVGAPALEHETARRLIAWKIEQRLLDPARHRSYGLHHTDPRTTAPEAHRVDICLSVEGPVAPNAQGVIEMVIPAMRCARARDVGSRHDNQAARYLVDVWLPASGEQMSGQPLLFHYVNVGPSVSAQEAITDVYLPLREGPRRPAGAAL